MLTKNELRKQFGKEWKKHYNLSILREHGFERRQCKACGRFFWSITKRETCGGESCDGYSFIGNPVGKPYGYVESWKTIEKYFVEHGHKSVYTYPSVARWREDLYFTIASISDFQPYVVRGEVEPPGNPLIIPQACIRFGDISNVGVTGRHCTSFVMIGQHAFNTKKKGLFYWKDDAIGHDIGMLRSFGVPIEEITFLEDVWMGGGNFGPSMEYFVRGLELGNCVFMQYQTLPDGSYKELDTKAIDMGAGLERFAWVTNGTPTVYDTTYGPVITKMFKDAGVRYDTELATKYWSCAGSLDIELGTDYVEKEKRKIADKLGITLEEVMYKIRPYQVLYASADHLKTVLLAVTDGQLPSNSGGGYNLRMILRRTFGFNEQFSLNLDYFEIIKRHAEHLKPLFPHYMEGVESTVSVIEEELRKYRETKNKAKSKIKSIIAKAKKEGELDANTLVSLYQSNGIPPEIISEEAAKEDIIVNVPDNFYDLVKYKDETVERMAEVMDISEIEKTVKGFYKNEFEMKSTVVALGERYIVLDKTCFYPESGGQVGDTGYIEGIRIINTIMQDNVIIHEVKDPSKLLGLKLGQKVHIIVDKERRLKITLHHTGVHLINACAREVLGMHIWQTGAYKDEFKAHIDLTHFKRITDEELNRIELLANKYIRMNLRVSIEELDRTVAEQKYGFRIYQGGAVPGKTLRIVSIGSIDHEACGGTHHMIKGIGELGLLKITKRESVKDGVERIIFKCGDEAIRYVQERERILKNTAKLIAVPENRLKESVKRFFEEWKTRGKRIEKLHKQIAKLEVQRLIKLYEEKRRKKAEGPVEIFKNMDRELLAVIGRMLSETDTDTEVILINGSGDVVCATGLLSKHNADKLIKSFAERYGGYGGGRVHIAFGKIKKIPRR